MGIILILILGLVLRLVNINQSLWLDESVQALTSQAPFMNLFMELRGDFHPPLYHLLMWAWVHLFGNEEFVMRLPSVLFGTATIYVVYLITRHLVNIKGKVKNLLPLISALFLATAPFHIYYSQEARMYSLGTFLTALSFYCFFKLINYPLSDKKLTIAYIFSTVLLLYANYYGLFIFLIQILIGIFLLRKRTMELLRDFLIIAIFFLPVLFLLLIQLKTGIQANIILPGWGELVNLSFFKALPLTFIKFSIGRLTIFNKSLYAVVAVALFILYGFLIANSLIVKKNRLLNKYRSRIIILAWLLVPIFLAWIISFLIPNYQPFRLLLCLPAFYLVLSLGAVNFSKQLWRSLAITLVLGVSLVSLGFYYTNPYFHREDWRGVVEYIEREGKEESAALLPSYTSHWPYTYYSQGKVPLMTAARGIRAIDNDDLQNLPVDQIKNFYYIYYLAELFDPQGLIINWLEEGNFVKIGEISFNQIKIQEWRYDYE